MFLLRIKKNNFQIHALIWMPARWAVHTQTLLFIYFFTESLKCCSSEPSHRDNSNEQFIICFYWRLENGSQYLVGKISGVLSKLPKVTLANTTKCMYYPHSITVGVVHAFCSVSQFFFNQNSRFYNVHDIFHEHLFHFWWWVLNREINLER